MSEDQKMRLFRLVIIFGAFVVLSGGLVHAQNSDGSFGPAIGNQGSTRSDQRNQFNPLPFRAASNDSGRFNEKPPIRLTTPTDNKQVVAMPASFGSPLAAGQPQLSPQDSQSVRPIPDYVDMPNCTVKFIDDILLPAKESGVIKSLSVKEGDYVPAGTVVGKIDDELYQRQLEQAKLRYEMAAMAAEDMIAIEAADKKRIVAEIEAFKTAGLADKGSKSESDRLMANYTKEIATLERDKAIKEKEKAGLEKRFEAARFMEVETHIRGHILQSDFDAFVIEVLKKPQEYVRQGDEVMRIARMDRLWVQGTVEISIVNPDEVLGRPVTVTIDRARGEETTFEGKITNVGLETQGGTRYLVKAEVQNRPAGEQWVLQPMSNARMRIHLNRAPLPRDDGSFGSTAKSN